MSNSAKTKDATGYGDRIRLIIEQALEMAGYSTEPQSEDSHVWLLQRGSAEVELVFHPRRGLIYADAYLAAIPPKTEYLDLYKYLLRENLYLNDISLSIKEDEVLLSFITNDRELSAVYLSKMLKKLLFAADKYDNILVEKFKASWPADRSDKPKEP